MEEFTFANLFKQYRHRCGFTQRELSEELGVSLSTVKNWELGNSRPRYREDVLKLEGVLRLDRGELDRLLETAAFEPEYFASSATPPPEPPPPFIPIADLPYFVGREAELADLANALQQGAFVNVCNVQGMGGVGKTAVAARLAYQLRSSFPDGVLWATLATTDTMTILSMFARAYGEEVGHLTTLAERSSFVRGLLADKRVLIILDDARKSAQIRPLLPPTTGKPAVIITTRRDLAATDGFKRLEVRPFTPESGYALALFAHFLDEGSVQQHRSDLMEIATLLGHLPLALAMAAARLAYTPGQTIADFLALIRQQDGRLDQLNREDRGVRLSFDVSYDALPSELKRFFAALGTFGGEDFGVEAVAAVVALPIATAAERLNELVQLSLVREAVPDRYQLHPLLYDYAREKITDKVIFTRMVAFFVAYLRQHEFDYQALDRELSNILAALQTAFSQSLLSPLIEGANALYSFLEARGLHDVARQHLNQALQAANESDDALGAALTLSNLAHLAYIQADYGQAEAYVRDGLNLVQQAGTPPVRGRLLYHLAAVHIDQGHIDQAETVLLDALVVTRQNEDVRTRCDILGLLGKVVGVSRGDYDQVEAYFQEGYTLAQQIEDPNRIIAFLTRLGALAYHRSQWQQAEDYYQKGLASSRKTCNLRQEANQLHSLGELARDRGKLAAAESYLQSALAIAEKINLNDLLPVTLVALGEVALEQEKLDMAKAYLQRSESIARQTQHTANLSYTLAHLGAVAVKQCDYDTAETYLREGLDLAFAGGQAWDKFIALRWWGELKLAREEFDAAASAWSQAREIAEETNTKGLLGAALFQLARLEWAQGNLTEALQLGQDSVAVLDAIGHPLCTEVSAWLNKLTK